ncbi:hypothetical protein KHC23_05760 [Ancylobacter dichloromethanicus]|uniref:Uncharacterized protein n=1 Tax=Ancylobacter dichloromethanicus TaxID=518825 RepID=A0A9W6JBF0_9HYPH|nr:hypothetical protein [Ancylobacter dichloromethanicus]MBS7553152.1 hypothetical protein [Ancylobacter dichloromethanicus]GLK72929.1 hypothetical protein GCM10017643_30450 [Ancylobacter dichloromethanicus]
MRAALENLVRAGGTCRRPGPHLPGGTGRRPYPGARFPAFAADIAGFARRALTDTRT